MDDLLLYNLVEGGLPRRLVGHDAGLKDIAFSPDGQVVATVGNDRRIKLWKVTSGQEIQSMEVHRGDVRSVDFSDNGHTLATGGDHGWVRLWHTETMQPLLEIDTGSPVWKVRFAAQDRCLIVQLGNHETRVFDASAEAPP